MQLQREIVKNCPEQAGYLEVCGDHVYTVLHEVADPIARVLLVGPFAAERHSSYVPWVRWARFLAARRIEALRYDYRGIGESLGAFEDMTFDHWSEDVECLASWLQSRSPQLPLVLHGLELGALLASRAFAKDIGNALLLWAPPANANDVLLAALRRRVAVEQSFQNAKDRKSLPDYIQRLKTEHSLEVDGYKWSSRLWDESFKLESVVGKDGSTNAEWSRGKPTRLVKLGKSAAPLVKGSSLGFVSRLNPDLSGLFADSFEWIANQLAAAPPEIE
jgi:alpha/beta superfamily hydrolase